MAHIQNWVFFVENEKSCGVLSRVLRNDCIFDSIVQPVVWRANNFHAILEILNPQSSEKVEFFFIF